MSLAGRCRGLPVAVAVLLGRLSAWTRSRASQVENLRGFLAAGREMAAAGATTMTKTTKEVDRKVQLMMEIRAHKVAIDELNNLPPSRAAYQKTCNLFFRKSLKSAVMSEQKQLDLAKAQLQKLDQA